SVPDAPCIGTSTSWNPKRITFTARSHHPGGRQLALGGRERPFRLQQRQPVHLAGLVFTQGRRDPRRFLAAAPNFTVSSMTNRTDQISRCRLLVWLGAVALTASGCGSGKVPVSGSVLFAGKPVEEGMITFEPADGKGSTTGGPVADGNYELQGDAAA